MKKIIITFVILIFATRAYAFEQPNGKTINKIAVQNGIETYSLKINSNPQDESAYVDRAFLHFLIGNIPAAIKDYDTLISINPNNEEYFLNRGYLKHIFQKREEALKDYDCALKIKPDYAFAHNNRGVVLEELGRNQESLIALNTAIKIDPNYADAYYNRGNLKTRIEKNNEALEDFNIAIQLNPNDSASFNNRGVVKRKLNYNVGALSDFSIAIKINPEDITAFANRGRLKKRYFDSEGAEEDFKTAVAIAEKTPIVVKEIEVQSEIKKAQNNTQHTNIQQENKNNETADSIQKIAYQKDNEPHFNAVKASVLKLDPKSNRTTELPNNNSNNEPKISTKPVINPDLAECYYIRALQKYILQNREGAIKDFNLAIQHNPKYAEAYYYRAAIKRDNNDEGFVDDYRTAIQLNPELKAIADADVLMILKK